MSNKNPIPNDVQEQIRLARIAYAVDQATEPQAVSAYYDEDKARIVVDFENEASFAFPVKSVEGLAGASTEDLLLVTITPSGFGLHWEALDVDLSIPQLFQGIFGTKAWMKKIGAQGGKSKSEAKAKASRANGKKGGRPRTRSQEVCI